MQYDRNGALIQTNIPELGAPRRGKVRDIFELPEGLLMVASDRLSAFDVVMPNGIPDKGRVLTGMSCFWFDRFDWMPNHVITTRVDEYPEVLAPYKDDLHGRSMLVKKTSPIPVECVVRGYLIGSGWKDYQKTGSVCGIRLKSGYRMASQLERPLFTPSSKAEQGEHDENITYAQVVDRLGADDAAFIRDHAIRLYQEAAEYAATRGIVIADTKFEFGRDGDRIILIDEALTCDSSRFWPADQYEVGISPPSLDKQYVRDYLETLDWGKCAPGPDLPDEVVAKTREKYVEAYRRLAGREL